jgi:hypothetical protein
VRNVAAPSFASDTKRDAAKRDLAEELKQSTTDEAPDLEGVWGDLLRSAICEIDWYEVAGNWIDEHIGPEEE